MREPGMQALPGAVITAVLEEAETGLVGTLGVQIRELITNTIVRARSIDNIREQPPGTGNYVADLTAPVEFGDYQIVWDKNGGVLTPQDTAIEELRVTATIPVAASGLGPVADAAWSHLGEHFLKLRNSDSYGTAFLSIKSETVKRRVMTVPPAVADEHNLDPLVIDYLGKLLALELIPPLYAFYANVPQTKSTGDRPTEITSYPDRIRGLEKVQEALLISSRRDEALVLPLIETPRLRESVTAGPAIDELTDDRVTDDPRAFPTYANYPTPRTKVMPS